MDGNQMFLLTNERHDGESGPIDCREKRLSLDVNRSHVDVEQAEITDLTSARKQKNVSHIVPVAAYSRTVVKDLEDVKLRQDEFLSVAQSSRTSDQPSDTVKNLVPKSMKSKVDSFTQVEPNFEGKLSRNILGQEHRQDIEVAGTLLSSECVPREHRKYIRPPLVGQASSSSNESGSVPVGRRRSASSELDNSYEEHDVSPTTRLPDRYKEQSSTDGGTYYTNISVRNFNLQPHCLTNRDDYINERPPEGSDQFIMSTGPADQPDSQRIPSPSSVSSVNSARPLEWDSGADVGYYQNYVADNQDFDPGLSTIERIALVCGTAALLTRSDPEGTTGPSGQVPSVQLPIVPVKTKRSKDSIGIPKGESTPVNFLQQKSSSTSAESETEISPIINENNATKNLVNVPSTNSKHSDDLKVTSKNDESKKSQRKYPLFPEVVLSKLQESEKTLNKNMLGTESSVNNVNDIDREQYANPGSVEMDNKCDTELYNKIKTNGIGIQYCENSDMFGDSNIINIGSINKKLSSSLENIRDLNKLSGSDDNMPQVSRPRSRSQTNLFTYPADSIKIEEHFSRCGIAFHYPKSGSSSSIATVVQKKRDSPKHLSKLVQTHSLIKHSTGIQAWEGDRAQNGVPLSNVTTPHIPSWEFRSNFKDMLDKEEASPCEAQRRQIEAKLFHSQVQNNLPQDKKLLDSHYHDGVLCTGAHKKTFQDVQQSLPAVGTVIHEVTYKKNTDDIKKMDDKCDSTLESVESSARSQGGFFFERQSSVTVEDRVNSFEYLPGDVYENAGRQAGTVYDAPSSESARNEVNEDKEGLWDLSASSTLVRDVQRGVDIMMDFIKSSHAADKQVKHKLIRRVVEKLINSDYASDRQEERISLECNVPWVPPVIQTKPTSAGRETKRFTESRVPKETTSSSLTTTDRSSSRTSSECFKPMLKDVSILKTKSVAEKCVGTGHSIVSPTPVSSSQQNASATPDITSDSTGRYNAQRQLPPKQPAHLIETNMNAIRKGRITAGANDTTATTSSGTVLSSTSAVDWRQPVTKTEKLYEQRRKQKVDRLSKGPNLDVLHYLDMERENQLFWIRSEIQHLNNLKTLLEKQEELKENIKEMRKSRYRDYTSGSDKKDAEKHHRRSATSSGSSANYKDSSLGVIVSPKKKSSHKNHQGGPSTLRTWLLRQQHRNESSEESHHNSPNLYRIDSHRQVRKSGKEWTSHENLMRIHEEEPKKNFKPHVPPAVNQGTSSLKQKENKSILKSRNTVVDSVPESSEETRERPRTIHTSPQRSSSVRRNETKPSVKNFYVDGVLKKNAQTETESVQYLNHLCSEYESKEGKKFQKRKSGCPCEKDGYICKCCKEWKLSGEDRMKQPVGYYITFEQSPTRIQKKKQQQPAQKERTEVLYSEPVIKQNTNPNAEQEVMQSKKSVSSARDHQVRSSSSDSDSQSKESNEDGGNHRNPTLQDYLVTNRPDYVSRAEDRRQCVAELVYLRELRDKSKRRLLELTDPGHNTRELPPPPLAVKRVFSQRTMRRQTEKKYRQLAEVQGKQHDMKRKQAYRTNRLMAQVFTKKLQRRVLKGEVNLSNSVSVISNI